MLDEIRSEIEKVLQFKHDLEIIDVDAPLTGETIKADALELVYIVLHLMKKYSISFEYHDFENYSFNTVREIANAVEKHINI